MRHVSILAVLLAAAIAVAAPPEIPKSEGAAVAKLRAAAPFQFPLPTVKPAPAPSPQPKADPEPLTPTVPVLAADVLYVIPSDEEFLLLPSPAEKVRVTKTTGPVTLFARFLDTPNEPAKLRTFTQKYVAIVQTDPKTIGRVELIAVPKGITDESQVVRQLIDLNQAPQPPPDVLPPPKPVPPPVPPEPKPEPKSTGPFWLVFLDDGSVETAKIVSDAAFLGRMKAAGHKVHFYGVKDEAAIRSGYVKVATVDRVIDGQVVRKAPGLPALIVVDEDGDIVRAVPRPNTVAEVETIVKAVSR